MYLEFLEYSLTLSTNEIIRISELDIGRIDDEEFIRIISSRPPPLDWVPYLSRSILEEAKIGHDTRLLNQLGSPPSACLLRLPTFKCSERVMCASYQKSCELIPLRRYKSGEFPRCWTIDSGDSKQSQLITSIVFRWLENERVIIVTDE
jgi:hypothetical protein